MRWGGMDSKVAGRGERAQTGDGGHRTGPQAQPSTHHCRYEKAPTPSDYNFPRPTLAAVWREIQKA